MAELLIRYGHFMAIMLLLATLLASHLLMRPEVDKATFQRLGRLDMVYGAAAVIALLSGLMLWFGVGKSASVYLSNGVFHLKLGLFVLISLLSAYPTLYFIIHRKAVADKVVLPKSLIMVVRAELALLLLLPLLATLMAGGVGSRLAMAPS